MKKGLRSFNSSQFLPDLGRWGRWARWRLSSDRWKVIACSKCFKDHGLQLTAKLYGQTRNRRCPRCGSAGQALLTLDALHHVTQSFFVESSRYRGDFGSVPIVTYNDLQDTSVDYDEPLKQDAALISQLLGIGFFHYGPRLWMYGHVWPLQELLAPATRAAVIARVLKEFPERVILTGDLIYRLRVGEIESNSPGEFDAPPIQHAGRYRLDSKGAPVLYGSQDIQVCIHECRARADDQLTLGTLSPTQALRLLDLSAIIDEPGVDESESLDLAIYMLFLGGEVAYPACRAIAAAAKEAGFDGVIYASYYSQLRTGTVPFENVLGIPYRRLISFRDYERNKVIENVALFGRPVAEGRTKVVCINKLTLRRIDYDLRFGPSNIPPEPSFEQDELQSEPNNRGCR